MLFLVVWSENIGLKIVYNENWDDGVGINIEGHLNLDLERIMSPLGIPHVVRDNDQGI